MIRKLFKNLFNKRRKKKEAKEFNEKLTKAINGLNCYKYRYMCSALTDAGIDPLSFENFNIENFRIFVHNNYPEYSHCIYERSSDITYPWIDPKFLNREIIEIKKAYLKTFYR